MKEIKLLVPSMPKTDELLPYLRKIDQSKHYTNFGPLSEILENRLSKHVLTPVQLVSNGTAGLETALAALDLPPQSRILVPAFTFIATGLAILRAGHIPVIADTGLELTPSIADQYDCEAVIPVCAFGRSNTGWKHYHKPVIVDAAAGFGNHTPEAGVCTIYSMHATKALGAGEGGFIASTNTSFLARCKSIINFGINGSNAKLSEYHCAVGLASLDNWKHTMGQRIHIAQQYSSLDHYAPPVPTMFPIHVGDAHYQQLRFKEQGIESRRYYFPILSHHPSMEKHSTPTPITDELSRHILCIPFHTDLSTQDIQHVLTTLKQ